MNKSQKRNLYLLIAILLLATLLRFWGIIGSDLKHDPAINSVRAFGWFDYLVGEGQTAPINWFGYVPWWANLSFHDHPPLSFLVQKISFTLFGDNVFAALLPFLLAGVLLTYFVYYFISQFKDQKTGLLASFIFAINAYAVWLSRVGYLEGLEILFIALAVFYLIRLITNERKCDIYFFFGFFGLAFLSKYTALFVIPAALLSLLLYKRLIFKTRKLYLSLVLLILILLPITVYNYHVFLTRGHLDAAFSSMTGMQTADYQTLSGRNVNVSIFSNGVEIWKSLIGLNSFPILILFGMAFFYVLAKIFIKKADRSDRVLTIHFLFLVVMFLFTETAVRFMSLSIIFTTVFLSIFIVDLFNFFASRKNIKKTIICVLIVIFCFELFYSINTNIVKKPFGSEEIFYSKNRFYERGFNELENYLKKYVLQTPLIRKKITNLNDGNVHADLSGGKIVLIDERIDWFSRMWHIDKYIFYYMTPIAHFTDAVDSVPDGEVLINYLSDHGITDFWMVIGGEGNTLNLENISYNQVLDQFETSLAEEGIAPVEVIKNSKGQISFKIYHFKTR